MNIIELKTRNRSKPQKCSQDTTKLRLGGGPVEVVLGVVVGAGLGSISIFCILLRSSNYNEALF